MSTMDDFFHPGIRAAIEWMVAHHDQQPSMGDAAAVAKLSPAHFSRAFHRWVGVSPKVFIKHLTLEHLKERLLAGEDLMSATVASGLSGTGRVHDHFVTLEAMTPGEFRRQGEAVVIEYGWHPSPFGKLLAAATQRGICFAAFATTQGAEARALADLRKAWPAATLVESPALTTVFASNLNNHDSQPLTLCVTGTNFQIQVWRALLGIPEGALTSYAGLAEAMGRPSSVRAVANAVGANPISWLIPCHRVIRSSGALGGYRWGLDAKRSLLARESAALAAAC